MIHVKEFIQFELVLITKHDSCKGINSGFPIKKLINARTLVEHIP